MTNLFDVHPGIKVLPNDKPRAATESEVGAYLEWIRQRHGLPDMRGPRRLHWRQPRNWRKGQRYCIGVTLGETSGGHYETGAYSIVMPGHDAYRQKVTMETLDDAGEVIASQTLPIEPKKGGIVWSRDDVRKAAGPVAKIKGKPAQIATPAPLAEISAPEPVQHESAPEAAPMRAEPVEALDGPEIAPLEPVRGPDVLLVDAIAELLARVEALEASVATLSGESSLGAIGGIEAAQKSKRSAAHERAVRRAWSERKAKCASRRALKVAEESNAHEYREWKAARAKFHADIAAAQSEIEARDYVIAECAKVIPALKAQRRRAVVTARASLSRLRTAERFQRQRADVLHAQLVRLRADMADASQPERASDLARLIRERDEARNAAAASQARALRAEQAVATMADRFEDLVTRVARAEAALRVAA